MEAGLSDRASKVLRAVLHEKAGMDLADLRKQGIVTKVRTLKTGETVGGIPFTRGPLAHLLRNRFYSCNDNHVLPVIRTKVMGEKQLIVSRVNYVGNFIGVEVVGN